MNNVILNSYILPNPKSINYVASFPNILFIN